MNQRSSSLPLLLSGDGVGEIIVWNLLTRRPIQRLSHKEATQQTMKDQTFMSSHAISQAQQPVLAIRAMGDGRIWSQGKDGMVHLWELDLASASMKTSPPPFNATTPTHTSQYKPLHSMSTGSYTFCQMQLVEIDESQNEQDSVTAASSTSSSTDSSTSSPSSQPRDPVSSRLFPDASSSRLTHYLLLPSDHCSVLHLFAPHWSLTQPIQTIECERRIEPSNVDDDESMAELMKSMGSMNRVQYEREVGSIMTVKFFQPKRKQHTKTTHSSALSSSSPASTLLSHPPLPDLYVIWGSESGVVGVWSVREAKSVCQSKLHSDPVLSIDIDWEGRFGVSAAAGKELRTFTFDADENRLIDLSSIHLPHEGLAEVCLRADRRLFATAGWDHRVRLFDCATMQPLAILHEHTSTVQCLAMDGRIVRKQKKPQRNLQPFSRSSENVEEKEAMSVKDEPEIAAYEESDSEAVGCGLLASGAKDGRIAVYNLYPQQEDGSIDTEVRPASALLPATSVREQHRRLYASRHPLPPAQSRPMLTNTMPCEPPPAPPSPPTIPAPPSSSPPGPQIQTSSLTMSSSNASSSASLGSNPSTFASSSSALTNAVHPTIRSVSSPLIAHAIRLGPGADLFPSLHQWMNEEMIEAACILSAVGSLRQARLRYANVPDADAVTLPTPSTATDSSDPSTSHDASKLLTYEVVSLVGTLSLHGGSHLHMSISDRDGRVFGGHVMPTGCIVYTTMEIIVGVMPDMVFKREVDPTYGYEELAPCRKG